MASNAHNIIDDDGTILSLPEDNVVMLSSNPYILATRTENTRKTFIVVSAIISLGLGLLIALLITPLFIALAGSESLELHYIAYIVLPLAGLWGAIKYLRRSQQIRFTRSDYFRSARCSLSKIVSFLLLMVALAFAFYLIIILAIMLICFKTMKSIFRG